MPREQLEALIGWLAPGKKPLLVQMPQAEYERAKKNRVIR
jgi:hypothetical protein